MGDSSKGQNRLVAASSATALANLRAELKELQEVQASHGSNPWPVPLQARSPDIRNDNWLSDADWMTGNDTFEILRLQTAPYEWGPVFSKICSILSGQTSVEDGEPNYVISGLPPNHALLEGLKLGSPYWFLGAEKIFHTAINHDIDGIEEFESDFYEWIIMYNSMRIRSNDVVKKALGLEWHWYEYGLPEAKQQPIWTFSKALAWVATRNYVVMARVGDFTTPVDCAETVAENGIRARDTAALGWLHTALSFRRCNCGAFSEFGWRAIKHCTCISLAWEELVKHMGGLTRVTPRLVFGLQEGWISMTWPDGADDIQFLRSDILERWPPDPETDALTHNRQKATVAAEQQCIDWLAKEFAADPDKLRKKGEFRAAALAAFQGRVSKRGFDLRVWPALALEHGRTAAGAKRKS